MPRFDENVRVAGPVYVDISKYATPTSTTWLVVHCCHKHVRFRSQQHAPCKLKRHNTGFRFGWAFWKVPRRLGRIYACNMNSPAVSHGRIA